MTEKSYSGNNGVREYTQKKINFKKTEISDLKETSSNKLKTQNKEFNENSIEIENYIKAGKIAKEVVEYTKKIIKPGILLIELAKEIEKKIYEKGGIPAFPVNLSLNEIAAHYHPILDDKTKAEGLLKIDIGVQIDGFIADTAFSVDLTPDKKFKELIEASQKALDSSIELLKNNPNSSLNEIGKTIQNEIQKKGFSPITNLSGHSLSRYNLHSGLTIPNYDNKNNQKLEEGAYAIEPFATTGEGKVIEGAQSNIYHIINYKNPRGLTARKILEYVFKKYKTLPFSLRELEENFGNVSRIAIRELIQLGIIYGYPQLIEKSRNPVSQAEHTIIKTQDGKIIVTTL